MGEWQPIETAPKNGTAVDVWIVKGTLGVRSVDVVWATPDDDPDGCRWEPDLAMPVEDDGRVVTHWTPIPSPPVTP